MVLTSGLDSPLQFHATTGLCSRVRTRRLISFLPTRVVEQLESLHEATATSAFSDKSAGDQSHSPVDAYITSAGTTMKCGAHQREFHIIDDSLPDDLLPLLRGRLAHQPSSAVGASSYFSPFTKERRDQPLSLIEQIILETLAPLVLGNIDDAVSDGYLGAEWWTQSRASSAPKEYHMDTVV